jgi:hypothetical protein
VTQPEGCIFCLIVAGDAPASFVYRDSLVSAFLDINAINPGHLLVVPNEHVALTRDLAARLSVRGQAGGIDFFGQDEHLATATLATSGESTTSTCTPSRWPFITEG